MSAATWQRIQAASTGGSVYIRTRCRPRMCLYKVREEGPRILRRCERWSVGFDSVGSASDWRTGKRKSRPLAIRTQTKGTRYARCPTRYPSHSSFPLHPDPPSSPFSPRKTPLLAPNRYPSAPALHNYPSSSISRLPHPLMQLCASMVADGLIWQGGCQEMRGGSRDVLVLWFCAGGRCIRLDERLS